MNFKRFLIMIVAVLSIAVIPSAVFANESSVLADEKGTEVVVPLVSQQCYDEITARSETGIAPRVTCYGNGGTAAINFSGPSSGMLSWRVNPAFDLPFYFTGSIIITVHDTGEVKATIPISKPSLGASVSGLEGVNLVY